MNLSQNLSISLKEYFKIRENSDVLLEYINGVVYMSPSPSTEHQRIATRLITKLGIYLDGNSCEVFSAPYDIELKKEEIKDNKIVIPDITVICDTSGFTKKRYIGIPSLIVEILSPSNQAHDLITKLNLYMQYGVKEYWIVNPMLKSITVYTLNLAGMYEQFDIKTEKGKIHSKTLADFEIDLEYIFKY